MKSKGDEWPEENIVLDLIIHNPHWGLKYV